MNRAYTQVELIVILAIIAVLFTVASVGLNSLQQQSYIDNTVETMLSDIKLQQTKAMTGDTSSTGSNSEYGIHFYSNNSYTLFKGSNYSSFDSNNFTVTQSSAISITTTFPQSNLIFAKGSGEVVGFISNQNTITVTNTNDSQNRKITINRFGVITQIQ